MRDTSSSTQQEGFTLVLLYLAEETFRSPWRPFLEPGSELTRWTPVVMLPWKEFPIIKMEGTERGPTAVSVLERISVHLLQTELVPEVTCDCASDPTCLQLQWISFNAEFRLNETDPLTFNTFFNTAFDDCNCNSRTRLSQRVCFLSFYHHWYVCNHRILCRSSTFVCVGFITNNKTLKKKFTFLDKCLCFTQSYIALFPQTLYKSPVI